MAAGPAGLGERPHAARSAGCNAVPVPVAFATDAWKLLAETRSDVGACWVRWTAEREGNRYEERSTAWLHCCTPNPLVDLTGGAIGLGLCRYNFDVILRRCRKENGVACRQSSSQPWRPVRGVAAAMRRHSGSAAPLYSKATGYLCTNRTKTGPGKSCFSVAPQHLLGDLRFNLRAVHDIPFTAAHHEDVVGRNMRSESLVEGTQVRACFTVSLSVVSNRAFVCV